ncbi:rhomboid family intramembrane serine protease [Gordonia phosphorivorans]|uniref:Rhomboid family intramembrane serine protease n=1 Tax=Gordonia phosphorivorans TaxID=1056982 RepID=A0ABV6HD64_9ACTN
MTAPARAADRRPRPAWQRSALIMAVIIAGLFVVEAIDAAGDYALDQEGIAPRSVSGLTGILWAPFLHVDFAHLIANAIPGAILGFLLLLAGRFLAVTAVVWVVSGFGVWLLAPAGTVTVGASGIVFGWLTYLLVRGLFNRHIWQVLGGLVLLAVYGGMLWGVLPQGGTVSWQGHLCGALGGVLAAWMLSGVDKRVSGGRTAQVTAGPR